MESKNRFTSTEITEATGQYGESALLKTLGGSKRSVEKGADLEVEGLGEVEVKIVQASQSVGLSISQFGIMKHRQETLDIPQYYALCFYTMFNKKRITEALKGCKKMELDEYINRYLIMETIFIFPFTTVNDFFEQSSNTLKSRGTMTSNIGPIKTFYSQLKTDSKSKLAVKGFTSSKPRIELFIVGTDLMEKIEELKQKSDIILSTT